MRELRFSENVVHKVTFKIPLSLISSVEGFCEREDIQNFCVFENQEHGVPKVLDRDGLPTSETYSVDIFTKSKEKSEAVAKKLEHTFKKDISGVNVEKIKECDWVDLYIKNQRPVMIENLLFYNPGSITPIKINASLAFGSGDHQTTRGCILMLFFLARCGFQPIDILDMGCGTGILSIGASKIWNGVRNIIAIDIDEDAVQIAGNNFRDNRIDGTVLHGSDLSCLRGADHVDLILCNILKKQLKDFSAGFLKILKKGGMIVVSGFTKNQYEEIDICYSDIGFKKKHIIEVDEWVTALYEIP
jgi:ribosomal protein L11 methyltransferase